jgi:hypothetical protein
MRARNDHDRDPHESWVQEPASPFHRPSPTTVQRVREILRALGPQPAPATAS